MKRAHCALACGCERTDSISVSGISFFAIRLWVITWSCSPAIATPETSKASASSVARTAPSIEFSNGTSARSRLALGDGADRLVDVRLRDRLDLGLAGGRAQRVLREGSGRAEEGDGDAVPRRAKLAGRAQPKVTV